MFNQQIHGSKRSLRSVEDFTEFEQRTAYFDGDQVTAAKKGVHLPDRSDQVAMMAQMQNMFDFPPAPKLDAFGKLDPEQGDRRGTEGEQVFYGKGRCGECHAPPVFLDNKMHDLNVERFYKPQMINDQFNHRRRADQDVHAARHQGLAALPARRASVDPGRHGGVLQSGAAA